MSVAEPWWQWLDPFACRSRQKVSRPRLNVITCRHWAATSCKAICYRGHFQKWNLFRFFTHPRTLHCCFEHNPTTIGQDRTAQCYRSTGCGLSRVRTHFSAGVCRLINSHMPSALLVNPQHGSTGCRRRNGSPHFASVTMPGVSRMVFFGRCRRQKRVSFWRMADATYWRLVRCGRSSIRFAHVWIGGRLGLLPD